MMTRRSGKKLLIRDRLSATFLIMAYLTYGDKEIVNSLCKSMMQSLSNIPKRKRIELYLKFCKRYEVLYRLIEEENLSFPTE